MLTYFTCIFLSISMAVDRSKLRREEVAIPNFIPQGSGSTTAEAGVAPIALRPATPAAAPRKLRREVAIFMGPFLLLSKTNSTPRRTAVSAPGLLGFLCAYLRVLCVSALNSYGAF